MADQEKKVVLKVPGQEKVDPGEKTQETPAFKDPLSERDTDTGSLEKMEDTRTRKTVKLKPASSPGFIPKLEPKKVEPAKPEPAKVEAQSTDKVLEDPIGGRETDTGVLEPLDDTKTRKTVKLKPLSQAAQGVKVQLKPLQPQKTAASESAAEDAGITDPLSARDTDTGSIEKVLDDTQTRKTIKLRPLSSKPAGGPLTKDAGAKLAVGEPALTPVGAKPTLKPAGATAPTLKPAGGQAPTLKPVGAAAPTLKPAGGQAPTLKPAAAPAKPEVKVSDSQKTMINPVQQAMASEEHQDAVSQGEVDDDTVKLKRPQKVAAEPEASETASPLPTVAKAKSVPGSKQTIKLRPSTGGATAGEAQKPEAAASKQTIKLTPVGAPKLTSKAAPSPSAPTIDLKSPSKPAVTAPSPGGAPKLNLPGMKPAEAKPAEAAPEEKKEEAAAPKKLGLSIPKKEAPAPAEKPEGEAEAEAAPAKGGLALKKSAPPEGAPKGPPSAQKGQERFEGKKKKQKAPSAASPFYTLLALATLILVGASAFVTAAQFMNLWEPTWIGQKIEIPYLSQLVK
jgi:hypothetical protein